MISGFYIYNHKGDTVISRLFRDDVTKSAQDAFRANVIHSRSSKKTPINTIGKEYVAHGLVFACEGPSIPCNPIRL